MGTAKFQGPWRHFESVPGSKWVVTRQRGPAPGLDGGAYLRVRNGGDRGVIRLRERQVGTAQLVGDLVGVIAGVGKAEAAVTPAAIDHVALLPGSMLTLFVIGSFRNGVEPDTRRV